MAGIDQSLLITDYRKLIKCSNNKQEGAYSNCWRTHDPNIVMKKNKYDKFSDFNNDGFLMWIVYTLLTETRYNFFPRVHKLVINSKLDYRVLMENLHHQRGDCWGIIAAWHSTHKPFLYSDWYENPSYKKPSQSLLRNFHYTLNELQVYYGANPACLDLHSGNLMIRPKTRQWVINDPLAFYDKRMLPTFKEAIKNVAEKYPRKVHLID